MQNVRISYRKPKLELYNTNKERLSILTDRTQLSAYNIVLIEKINEVAELSFTIPFENTKITYDDCEKLIKFENEFYIIKNISVNDSNSRMMDVTCYHESVELKGLVCEPIDVIGATVEVMYMKILSSTSQKLSGYAWGGTDIPSTTKRHLQSENENSFFENLLSMAKVFDARLEFRSDAFGMIRIYIKKEDIDKGKYIKKGKDLKQLNIVYNSDEIFTRLTPYGATDSDGVELNILGVNNGKSYVEDYSYYLAKGMTMDEILKTPKCLQMTVSRYSEIVDAKDLLRIAKEELSKHCVPQLNGSINILDFSIFENSVMTAPIIGERVTVINKDINFKLYAKITGVERNYDNPLLTKVQISNMVKYDSVLKDLVHQGDKIDRLTDKNGNITEGALKDPVTNLVADKVNFKDLTANNILFGTAVGGTLDLQTLLAKHISGENGQFLNITTANTTIQDAVIKDAMIESVNAGKINAGTVNTNNVHIQSENGGIVIADNTQQFKDKNGNVRIQMGQDKNGDFNFAVFDETGTGTLIDATGVKEKALADGIIKDRMINEGEIGGKKINISSLITEINKDTNTNVIKSSKVQLDTENQTLDVAFKTLKTNVDNIQVGGRNYALDTKNTYLEVDPNNYHALSSVPFNLSPDFISSIRNKQVTISALVEGEFDFTTEGSNVHWGVDICVNYVDGTSTWLNLTKGTGLPTTGKIPKKVYSFTKQVLDKEINRLSNVNMFIRGTYTSITKFSIKDLKVEIGNKATDWTPAPEDIDSKIETNTTSIGVMQGKIETLIKDTTIEKDGQEIKLKDAYSKLDQTVGSINTTVGEHTTAMSGLASRVKEAEQKLEPDKIVATVKDHKTNGTNTFALSSQLTQTADRIEAKFESSGGYNIVKNGGFKNGGNGWWIGAYNPNGTNRSMSVLKDDNPWVLDGTCALTMRSTNNTSGEFRVDSQKFKVKQNTNYTLSYLTAGHRVSNVGHYVRGNEWEILVSKSYVPNTGGKNRNNWTRITQTFNTGSNHQISVNFIHWKTQNDGYTWVTDVMINEGDIALPWSPHPSEIYEGSTVIDATGVTIKNGALKVENKNGQTVLEGNTNGTLYAKDGAIVVANSSGDAWNNYGYRTTLLKNGLDFNWDTSQTGSGLPPYSASIYLDYTASSPGIIADGIKEIRGGAGRSINIKSPIDVTGGLAQNGKFILNGSDTWLRTYGNTGWYNETYQGGWYMTDSNWIRAYNSKSIYTPGSLQAVTSTYTRLLASNRLCGWDNKYKFYLGDTDSATRIDCSGGILRLYTSWLGSNDNGISIDWRGGMVVKYDSKIIHAFNVNGTKVGGTMEIEGTTYGMSPVDSPQALISYIEYDIEIDGEKKIYLDPIYRKMISRYSVFSSNPDIRIVKKSEEYFVVKGTGIADFDIKGQRKDAQEYFKIMGGFEHGSEEEFGY